MTFAEDVILFSNNRLEDYLNTVECMLFTLVFTPLLAVRLLFGTVGGSPEFCNRNYEVCTPLMF